MGNRESGIEAANAVPIPYSPFPIPDVRLPSCPRLLLVQPARQRLLAVAVAAIAIVERHAPDHAQKLVRITGHAKTLLVRHLATHVELVQRVVERLHAVLLARLHERVDLVDLVVTNERANRGRHHEDLRRHRAPAALGLRQQRLRDDPFEDERELRPHL